MDQRTKPTGIDFSRYVAERTRDFAGRVWLLQALDAWLADAGGSRFFLLSGEPGAGKTAIAGRLWQLDRGEAAPPSPLAHLAPGFLGAAHFCSARDQRWTDPRTFAQSLALQLAARHPAFAQALITTGGERPISIDADINVGTMSGGQAAAVVIGSLEITGVTAQDIFNRVVREPLEALFRSGFDGQIVLLVDALDEAPHAADEGGIVALLTRSEFMPAGVRAIITASPSVDVTRPLQRAQSQERNLTLGDGLAASLDDIRAYLARALERQPELAGRLAPELSPDAFVEAVAGRSQGNFLYVQHLLAMLAAHAGPVDAAVLDALPDGLDQVYLTLLEQLAADDRDAWPAGYAPILGTLAVTREALSEAQLGAFAGIPPAERRTRLSALRPLLDVDESLPADRRTYAIYHRSFADFLLDGNRAEEFWCDGAEQHRRIVAQLAERFPDPAQGDDYALRHLAYHLRQAGPAHSPRLYALITPPMRRLKRVRYASDAVFRQDLAEALAAAASEEPAKGLPQLLRCSLIDAALGSMIAEVPPDLLRDLARDGQVERALAYARLRAGSNAASLRAVVDGLLLAGGEGSLRLARQVAEQIPTAGEGADQRAAALAQVAERLTRRADSQAPPLFAAALAAASAADGLDSQARALAHVARLLAPHAPDQARAAFDTALERVRAMSATLDEQTRDQISMANMVAQRPTDSDRLVGQTPFDTLGAKARALADVAAEMALVGDDRSAAAFAEAEAVASEIDTGGIHAVFGQNTAEYIAARRAPPPAEAPTPPDAATLEQRLQAGERVPPDRFGFYGGALLAIARALLAAGDAERAGAVLARVAAAADEAEGGYQARILAELADLWRAAGDQAQADAVAARVHQIAGAEVDLPTSYRAWLAQRGRDEVMSLRQVATARAAIVKRRSSSDGALSQMAQSLAPEDAAGALELARAIGDTYHRAHALGAVAGHLGRRGEAGAAELLEEVEQLAQAEPEDRRDGLLLGVVERVAPMHAASARRLSASLHAPDVRASALVEIAGSLAQQGEPADAAWGEAWGLAADASKPTATLALAAARIGRHWAEAGDARASDAFAHALQTARALASTRDRTDALIQAAVTMRPSRPDAAAELLREAEVGARQLAEPRGRGRALALIAGAWMDLDPVRSVALLADLRHLGRENVLDGLAQIVPAAARAGGAALAWALADAVQEARTFFA